MTKLILGLHGRRRVGKDTAADYLVSEHGFTKIAFADALREECSEKWFVPKEWFLNGVKKDLDETLYAACNCINSDFLQWAVKKGIHMTMPRSPRWVLQNYADFKKEKFGDDIWAKKWQERAILCPGSVVASDVRFDLEAEYIRVLPGFIGIVEIFRRSGLGDHPNTHHSDARISQHLVDDWIINQTNVAIFESSIKLCLEDLLLRARQTGNIPSTKL